MREKARVEWQQRAGEQQVVLLNGLERHSSQLRQHSISAVSFQFSSSTAMDGGF